MATFNYTVDTYPMAEEIGSVSNHVKATATAVVAMQTAVVFAEAQAADHICNNVNKGFYTLIRSQISQKLAKLQSEVDSHLMQLTQQRKQLMSIKVRMERDYNMISSRYLKLFNGLNSNLRQRVYELDKPTIDFGVREMEKVANRTKYLTATVPITQLESLATSQKIVASNIKFRSFNVINSMTRFLEDMNEQKKLTNRILLETNNKIKNFTFSVPTIISELNYDNLNNKSIEISVSNEELNKQSQTAIKNAIISNLDNLYWINTAETSKDLQSEFSRLLSTSNSTQRVKDMARKLFLASSYQKLKNQPV
jgi:hypothetical protein